jgi:hypothetical protein
MEFLVMFRNRQPSKKLKAFARRTLGFALDRFASRIASVMLRVRDDNGPRGGADQRCSLEIQLVGGRALHLQDVDTSAEKCVHRLARRAARLVGKSANLRMEARR